MQNNSLNSSFTATFGLTLTEQTAATTGLMLTRSSSCSSMYGTPPMFRRDNTIEDFPLNFDSVTMRLLNGALAEIEDIFFEEILEQKLMSRHFEDAAIAVKEKQTSEFHYQSVLTCFESVYIHARLTNVTSTPMISFKKFVFGFLDAQPIMKGTDQPKWQEQTATALLCFLRSANEFVVVEDGYVWDYYHFCKYLRLEGYQYIAENSVPDFLFQLEFFPKEILVGVETNPGPTVNRNMQLFLQQNRELYIANRVRFWTCCQTKYSSLTYETICFLTVHNRQFRKEFSRKSGIRKNILVLIAFHSYQFADEPTLFHRTDNGFLVGVETNPGPSIAKLAFWIRLLWVIELYKYGELGLCVFFATALANNTIWYWVFTDYIGRLYSDRPIIAVCMRYAATSVALFNASVVIIVVLFCWIMRLVGIEPNPGPVLSKPLSESFKRDGFIPQGLFDIGLDSNTMDVLSGFSASLNKIADNPQVFKHEMHIPLIDNLFQKVIDNLPSFASCQKICWVLATVACGVFCKNRGIAFQTVAAIFAAYAAFKYCDILLNEAIAEVVNILTQEEDEIEVHPQVGKENFVTAILSLVYCHAIGGAYSKGAVTGFLKTVSEGPKLRDGVSYLMEFVLDLVQSFANFLCDKANWDRLEIKSSLYPEIDKIYAELNKLTTDFREGAPYNYDNAMILFELEKRANNVFAAIPNTKEFADYKRSAMGLLTIIKPLVSRMERNNITGNGPRREPLGIMLGGASGVGKSTSIVPLILAVNSLVLPEEKLEGFKSNHNDYIWNFIPENPFFDSYHGQFNTIIDEAGAHYDVAGTPDPGAMGAIRMINTANFPLHMAHLEDKGNCNFNSELVWSTTNRKHFDWKSMYLPEAYARRFKLSYLHVPKIEYCKEGTITQDVWDRRLDNSKIPFSDDGFVMSISEFYPYNFQAGVGKITGPPISFEELVLLIAKTYESHKQHGDKLLNFHSIQKDKFIAMRSEFRAQGPVIDYVPIARWFNLSVDFVREICIAHKFEIKATAESYNEFWRLASQRFAELLPKSTLQSWYDTTMNLLVNKGGLLAILAVTGVVAIMWKVLKPVIVEQSGDVRSAKPKSARPGRTAVVRAMPQSGISQNCIDISLKIMTNNVYTIGLVGEKGVLDMGYITFIYGRVALMPEHFAYTIEGNILEGKCEKNPIIRLRRTASPDVGFDVQYKDIDLMHFDDCKNDVSYLKFPRVVHNHADLTKFFADEEELPSKFDAALLRKINGVFTLVSTAAVLTGALSYGSYSTTSTITYSVATKVGECGALLITSGSQDKPRICGMHVAGNTRSGMSTKFRLHHILAAKAEFGVDVNVEPDLTPPSKAQVGDSFVAITEVRKLRTATKNQVIPSPLHESWGPSDYAPSALKAVSIAGVLMDPWKNARDKYSCVSGAFNMRTLDTVTQGYCSEILFSQTDEPWSPRIFSFEESVRGIPGVPFCEGVARNTSAGYPFCLDIKNKGKKDFFGSGDEYEFDSEACTLLKASIDQSIAILESGGRMQVAFADFLKDERRKKAKVETCATRLISASPLDYSIICRMYFGDFVRSMMANRITNSCAIGVNPFSHEWELIAQHLTSVGDTTIFGDFSGYDGSLCQTIEYKTLDVIEAFYSNSTPEERQIRRGLFEDIVNSKHVTVGPSDNVSTLYEWFGSNPSGNFLTTVMNSVCNVIGIRYTIVTAFAKEAGYTHLTVPDSLVAEIIQKLPNNAKMMTFGDDNGIGVSKEFAKTITQQSMTDSFKDIGFKYTDEAKTGNVLQHRVLQQCSFLKRGFVYDVEAGRHIAPLELAVILESPYWTKTNAPPGSVEATVSNSLMELSLHGEAVFLKYSGDICRNSAQKIGFFPNASYSFNRAKAMNCQEFY